MSVSWGDTIFSGFSTKTPEEAQRRHERSIMQEVGYILHNHGIDKSELVRIIQKASDDDPV